MFLKKIINICWLVLMDDPEKAGRKTPLDVIDHCICQPAGRFVGKGHRAATLIQKRLLGMQQGPAFGIEVSGQEAGIDSLTSRAAEASAGTSYLL